MNKKLNTKQTYKIFRVDESDETSIFPKKITVLNINAKDDEDAYQQLKEYSSKASKEYKYYVEPSQIHTVINADGTKTTFDNFFDRMNYNYDSNPWYVKAWTSIDLCFYRHVVTPISNFRYWCRDTVYLLKHKQTYQASWTMDDVLLDTIVHNIPLLKKYKHTLSWKMLDQALLEAHKNEKDFDLEKYHQKHGMNGYSPEIEKRSVVLEHELFDRLVADIKAYRYYSNWYEYIDKTDLEMVELDKKLRPALPLIKGSYDRYDYKKLNKIADGYWNRIWETIRVYGREFND